MLPVDLDNLHHACIYTPVQAYRSTLTLGALYRSSREKLTCLLNEFNRSIGS